MYAHKPTHTVEGSGTYAQKFVQDHDVLVKKGEDAVLHAGAIGFPVPSYRWTLGVSVEIDVNAGSRFSTADHGRELRISYERIFIWIFYNSRSWAINLRCLTLKIEFERPQIRVYSIEFVFNFRQFTSGRCALKTEEPIGANTKTCTQTVWQW